MFIYLHFILIPHYNMLLHIYIQRYIYIYSKIVTKLYILIAVIYYFACYN